MISYDELKKMYDQMSSVSNYDEAVAANNAAIGVFEQPKQTNTRNRSDPWIPPAPKQDNVDVIITPPVDQWRLPNVWETLFPPVLLWDLYQGGGKLTEQIEQPTQIIGTPDAVSETLNLTPGLLDYQNKDAAPAAADPLSGLGSTVDLIVKFLPIILVVGLFTSIKKVF